jgi:ribosomal 50S subunit-recycling heat shock protein
MGKKRSVSRKFCGRDKVCINDGNTAKESLEIVITKETPVSVNSEANESHKANAT